MSDWMLFRGDQRRLYNAPLETVLRTLPRQPDFRLETDAGRNGYIAHWEVRPDDTLWLDRLETRSADDGPDPGLRLLFPDAIGPVPATWVSHRLRSPDRDAKRFTFGGTINAREVHLWLDAGRLILIEEYHGVDRRRVGATFTSHLDVVYGPEEADFIRSIHATPGDSAPKLVYADWLEERNDPRGPVIRLVERLGRLSPEAAARERTAHADLLRRGLRQGLWAWVLGYDNLAAATHPILTER